ncbi:hypothetical protein [Shewanella sp. NKUCC06_TVS]|uniref:hypothetical protein n=1 Tax=Shewanella sp. NKUCC06_TVS TaxID=2842128 RepID=UPI001C5BC3F9|nr:hypothetical protein [Shewanella sp. NKUCC06_TVS]MBW3532983.1 hypothetical protein [Shewanella sp. NKUCC06_TVS]
MYTSNAYYPSPIDGNIYPIYVFLANGQLAVVHFFQLPSGLNLVYYAQTNYGQPPVPTPVCVSVNQGVSNLVYFQPQPFGQNQLLYCTSHLDRQIDLMFNSAFQVFLPVSVYDRGELNMMPKANEQPANNYYIDQYPNRLPVNPNTDVPPEIIQGLLAVQNGQLASMDVNTNQYGFYLTAEDNDGNRFVFEKTNINGINTTNQTTVIIGDSKIERQSQVKVLRSRGMTQIQIANHLGVSQKTISNDLKELGLN